MTYITQVYGLGFLGHDTDFLPKTESLEDALKAARTKVKEHGGGTHAVISAYGGLVATVLMKNGRLQTKKAKR